MKRIVLSLLMLTGVAAATIAATGAYWSSVISNTGNTFATGTLALNVNGKDQGSQTAVFGEDNLAPGSVIPEHTFVVDNVGTLNGNHLDLQVNLTGDTDLAKYIVFSGNTDGLRFGGAKAGNQSVRMDVPGWTAGDAEYKVRNGTDGSQITGPNANTADDPTLTTGPGNGMDRDGDGKVTLADLAVGKVRISPNSVNAGINAGTGATLWMNSKLDTETPDSMQGKTVTAEFVWTLHQDASQY